MDTIADIRYPISEVASRKAAVNPRFVNIPRHTADRAVYDQLKQAILCGELSPDEWLRQDDLAASFGVSRMPVRDALRALAADGLVELLPHRGARVVSLSLEELEEIYAARLGLEGLAARLAANCMTPQVLERMAELLPQLQELRRLVDPDAYLRTEAEYHLVCYSASGRERLCRTVADLRDRATRYLRVVFDTNPVRFEDSFQYQRLLFEACQRRDGSAAEQILQDALRWTLRHAAEFFSPTGPLR